MSRDPVHIVIDGNEANVQQKVGSNVYAFELLTALERVTRRNNHVSFTIVTSQPKVSGWPKARKDWKYQLIKPKPFWTQWALPLYLYTHQNEIDLFFTPGHYAPRFCPVPYVSSVMDLAFLSFPNQFKRKDFLQLKHWTAYSVKKAARVVTISQYSQQAIKQTYGTPESKINVIYPGYTPPAKTAPATKDIKRKYRLSDHYLVYVGTFQPRKNLERLVRAFEKTCYRLQEEATTNNSSRIQKLADVQLVLAGKIGWLAEPIMERIKTSPFADRIITPGFVSEEDKVALIEEATGLLQLGLSEGFGIPALEALHHQTVPLVANNSSLPEVVGEAGLLADPTSTLDIAEQMYQLITLSAAERGKLYKAGRIQKKKFDWKTSARQLYKLLLQVIEDDESNPNHTGN